MVTFVLFLLTNRLPTPLRDHYVDATQLMGWGRGICYRGYVNLHATATQLFLWGMLTFLELGHMVDATCIYVVGW